MSITKRRFIAAFYSIAVLFGGVSYVTAAPGEWELRDIFLEILVEPYDSVASATGTFVYDDTANPDTLLYWNFFAAPEPKIPGEYPGRNYTSEFIPSSGLIDDRHLTLIDRIATSPWILEIELLSSMSGALVGDVIPVFYAAELEDIGTAPRVALSEADVITRVPAPEPPTMLLVCTGLVGLLAFGRRKPFKK